MDKYLGLTEKEVLENRKKYGSNELKKENKNSFISLFIESLGDPIIKILLIALAIKIIFLFKDFDWFETIGILIAIFLVPILWYLLSTKFINQTGEHMTINSPVP